MQDKLWHAGHCQGEGTAVLDSKPAFKCPFCESGGKLRQADMSTLRPTRRSYRPQRYTEVLLLYRYSQAAKIPPTNAHRALTRNLSTLASWNLPWTDHCHDCHYTVLDVTIPQCANLGGSISIKKRLATLQACSTKDSSRGTLSMRTPRFCPCSACRECRHVPSGYPRSFLCRVQKLDAYRCGKSLDFALQILKPSWGRKFLCRFPTWIASVAAVEMTLHLSSASATSLLSISKETLVWPNRRRRPIDPAGDWHAPDPVPTAGASVTAGDFASVSISTGASMHSFLLNQSTLCEELQGPSSNGHPKTGPYCTGTAKDPIRGETLSFASIYRETRWEETVLSRLTPMRVLPKFSVSSLCILPIQRQSRLHLAANAIHMPNLRR